MIRPRAVTHEVKIERHWWIEIAGGRKTSELRRDDRDYQIGDQVRFVDAVSGMYWGTRRITHVLKHVNGLAEGFVVLSLDNPDHDWWVETAERRGEWLQVAERRVIALKGVTTRQRNVIKRLKAASA